MEAHPLGNAACQAGSAARILSSLLLGAAILWVATASRAAPLATGCCDSLTAEATNGYLPLLYGIYDEPNVDDQAVGARSTAASLAALDAYLGTAGDGVDPDVVVVLAGTTDPFWVSGATPDFESVANIRGMVAESVADGATPIVVAPPPILDTCTPRLLSTCQEIDDYVSDLREGREAGQTGLVGVASDFGLPYIDLYTLFEEYLPYVDLYQNAGGSPGGDGIHPNDEGDRVIAQAVIDELGPMVGAPCEDGVDNDGDGLIDFGVNPGNDPGCDDPLDWTEGTETADPTDLECDDGIDNDFDGAIDLDDFGCHGRGDFSERTAPTVIVCDDGIDNDGDGTIDYLGDAGCGTPVQMTENPKCNDGIDNDGDGLKDFDGGQWVFGPCNGQPFGCPAGVSDPDQDGVADPDPHCGMGSTDREQPSGLHCGFGYEVALALMPLMWWHRRRALRR